MNHKRILAGALLGASLLAAPAMAAITTFAVYDGVTTDPNMRVEKSGPTSGAIFSITNPGDTTPGSVPVHFEYKGGALEALGQISALFTLNAVINTAATITPIPGFGTQLTQPVGTGTFSFVSTQAFNVGATSYGAGTNLLSGSFCTVALGGLDGATAGSFNGSTNTCNFLTFTSDILSFAGSTTRDFSIALGSITPSLGANQGEMLNSFSAFSDGSFSADPAPSIPEPGTWMMMILGMGLVGHVHRRRRVAALA